jgi:hypothetical protein
MLLPLLLLAMPLQQKNSLLLSPWKQTCSLHCLLLVLLQVWALLLLLPVPLLLLLLAQLLQQQQQVLQPSLLTA